MKISYREIDGYSKLSIERFKNQGYKNYTLWHQNINQLI